MGRAVERPVSCTTMTRGSKRNEHGQYRQKHTDEEILDAVRQHEPASTNEVAEAVGYAQRSSAAYRLEKLEEAGLVRRKKIGRELVWMLGSED